MRLANKAALVTGGSRGIGFAIASSLGAEGARVAICGRDGESLRTAETRLREQGVEVFAIQTDVSDTRQAQALVEATVNRFNSLDILVNNAGVTRDSLLLRMSEDDWDLVLDINLKGAFNTCRAAIRNMMRSRWGRIVNISSVVGLTGNPGQTNYSASKAGLIGFTKSLAKEVASRGITANVVAPGLITSEMTDKLSDEQRKSFMDRIPVGRPGEPGEVAGLVTYLCLPESAYITGQVIAIDGGLSMS